MQYYSPETMPNLTEMWEEASAKARKKNVMVIVDIRTQPKTRTTGERSQNRHLNGHIQQIAEETGNEFGAIKTEIKYRAIAMGYPMLVLPNGNYALDLYGRPIGISESECTTVECGYLIDQTHILAGELGIFLKESDD